MLKQIITFFLLYSLYYSLSIFFYSIMEKINKAINIPNNINKNTNFLLLYYNIKYIKNTNESYDLNNEIEMKNIILVTRILE